MSAPLPASAAPPRVGFASIWGLLGVLLLLGNALRRLAPYALEAVQSPLTGTQWAVLALWLVFMSYAEGWRGFHRRFSPMVAARVLVLGRDAPPLRALLAPVFCMALISATRRRLITSWVVVSAITLLVIGVRQLSQPWRGIVDAGVVVGLGIGTASILYWVVQGLKGAPLVSPQLPEGPQRAGALGVSLDATTTTSSEAAVSTRT